MSERPKFPPDPKDPSGQIFIDPPNERSFPTTAVAIAALAVLVIAGAILLAGRHGAAPNSATTAAYASNLDLSGLQASQSESLSGGRSTYIDGHITNHGSQTVTGVTVQALFPNDAGQPPQSLTAPLAVIRAREPYIDTQPLSAAPLAPGAQADFRLIFEGVNDSWNEKLPEIHVTSVTTR